MDPSLPGIGEAGPNWETSTDKNIYDLWSALCRQWWPRHGRHWHERSKQLLTFLRGSGELNPTGAELLRTVENELARPGEARYRKACGSKPGIHLAPEHE